MDDKKVIEQALERAKSAHERNEHNVTLMREDLRFRAGSPDNMWQWPDNAKQLRGKNRPMLTINKIPQHINQVTNDMRQNRPQIKYLPVDDKADKDTADILNGLARHIENVSDAPFAYDIAADNQVTAGIGWVRVLTDYVSDDSEEQEIYIRPIKNIFSVLCDPNCEFSDASDAQWVMVYDDIPEKEFERLYPDAEKANWEYIGHGMADWYQVGSKMIRVAEYWCIEREFVTLNVWPDGTRNYDKEHPKYAEPARSRRVEKKYVMYYKMTGQQVLESRRFNRQYLPFARAIGNEFIIDGKTYYSGLVRNAKDPQRMYNYWASQECEVLALAPKAPFIGYAGQFEGFEQEWDSANVVNYSKLEVNATTDATGDAILPLPQRQAPPLPPAGILQAKVGASEDIKAVTGQYDASLGMRSNETSGRAILARQREGDTATYHYVDNWARMIRQVGRIILDCFAEVYDTPRLARIMAEDGESDHVQIDATLPVSKYEINGVKIFNPTIGRYDVVATAGPSYATKRQESVDAMSQLLATSPNLMQVIGDIFIRNQDWPGAQEMYERMKKMLPPQLQDDGEQVDPKAQAQINELQQGLQQALSMVKETEAMYTQKLNELADQNDELKEKAAIEIYKAETERIKVLQDKLDPMQVAQMAAQLVMQTLNAPPMELENDTIQTNTDGEYSNPIGLDNEQLLNAQPE